MKRGHWILDEKERIIEVDLMTWAYWFEKNANRIIKQEWVGEAQVSTIFLGIDHNFKRTGPPILWETMVFNGPLNHMMDRCAGSKEQAEAMHKRMVDKVKAQEGQKTAPSSKKV